jgi:hypothetical protein
MPSPRSFNRGPASCPGCRFADKRQNPEPHPEGISRYGVIPRRGRGLPTALPVGCRFVLDRSSRGGFRRYERVIAQDRSCAGQITYPTRNFALVSPHVAMGLGPSLRLACRNESAGVWPLRIPEASGSVGFPILLGRLPLLACPAFPADCPQRTDCHSSQARVPPHSRSFQQIASCTRRIAATRGSTPARRGEPTLGPL